LQKNLENLDSEIRQLENTLQRGSHDAQGDRSLVNQIDAKNRLKREIKDLAGRVSRILELEPKVEKLTGQIDTITDKIIVLKEEEAGIRGTIPNEAKSENVTRDPALDELYEKKRELMEQRQKFIDERSEVRNKVKESKQKWIEEDKEKKKI